MILLTVLAVAALEPQSAPPTIPTDQPAPAAAPVIVSPDGFRVGIDTFQTVTAKLGKPKSVSSNSSGTTVAIYIRTKVGVKAATFIPYVGMFAGGAKSKMSYKTFTFDANSILQSYTSSDDSTDCNTSVFGASCH